MPANLRGNPSKSLTIMTWNANSVRGKKAELSQFIIDHGCDVCLLSETFLKPHLKFKLANLSTYRIDRDTHGGGVAILVRRGIEHHEIVLPALTSLEALGVVVQTGVGPLRVITAYKSPKTTLDTADLDLLFHDPIPTILAGDLNSKHPAWNSRITNASGRLLFRHASRADYLVMGPDTPTYYSDSGHRPDVLDITIAQNISCSIRLKVIQELTSDHNPVLVEYGNEVVEEPTLVKINTKNTNWDVFAQYLTSNVGDNTLKADMTTQEIDNQVEIVTDHILGALKASTKTVQRKAQFKHVQLPPHVMQAIREKNRVRKLWQKYRDPYIKTKLNRMSADVRHMTQEALNESWAQKLATLNTQNQSLWQMTKNLLRIPSKVPPLHGQNGMAYSSQEKADALADTLESAFMPNNDPSDLDHIEEVARFTRTLRSKVISPNDVDLVTVGELKLAISKLKNKKAPGADNIPNVVLKNLPTKALMAIVNLFNCMLKRQHFAKSLKHSKIVLFHKPGKDPAFPQNYRPISLLTGLSKLFEKIILARLQLFIDANDIIMNEQFGFRKKHSTDQQLLRLTETITRGFNEKRVTGVVFLDIAQAFDKVWHRGLISKLMKLNFPTYLIKLIASYLQDRSFQVSHGSSLSSARPIKAGVPQGSLLGPTLFNIYINDMPRTPGVDIALYADDTALVAQSLRGNLASRRLQLALDNLETWYELWRIKVNVSKSNAVLFTKRRKTLVTDTEPISLFDEDIPWKSECKYLGVVMDKSLNWNAHLDSTVTRVKTRLGLLRPLVNRRSALSVRNGLTLYKTLILPVMTYASAVWGASAKGTKKLQVFQNIALRRISRSPWFVRNADIQRQLGVDLFKEHIKELARHFYSNLDNVPNSLVNNLASYDSREKTKYIRPKAILA